MDKYGLIGYPIAHSQSPALFQAAYGGRFQYDLIEGKYFEESYRKFLSGYKAINVTAPFKEQAFDKANVVSGPATLIGAANILVNTSEGVHAYNSDFTGVILTVAEALWPGIIEEFYGTFGPKAHIKVHQFLRSQIQQRFGHVPRALVVGLGGAGKAASVAAAEMGCLTTISNRTTSKAETFARGLKEYNFQIAGLTDIAEQINTFDIIIYTIPVALTGLKPEHFRRGQLLLEANYRDPSFSGLTLARLQDIGVHYIHGINWLLNQAISGYAVMTGETPDAGSMISIVER